jgi:hypothetical protein
MDLVEPYVRSGLSEVSSSLPSIMEVDIPAELRTAGSGAATALAVARATFQYAPWIALFWLLWVTVFAVRDLRSWLRWWGDGLFLTGLSLLVIGFAAGPFFTWSVERMIDSRGISGFSPNVLALVLDVFNLVVDGFSQRLLVQAGIILGIGVLMLIVRLFTRRPSNGQVGTQLSEPRAES